MSRRNSRTRGGVMLLTLATAAAMAQPQPPMPATGNGSVAGVVLNSATGAPLPRTHVTLYVFGNTGAQLFGTVTDAEGKFTIGALPPGQLSLNLDHVGFIAPATGNRLPDAQLRADEKKEGLKLSLTPTGAISGRVLDAEGIAVQGAIVSLDAAPSGVNPVTSDEKGQFRISGVPPGWYRVVANPAVMPFPAEIRTDGTSEVHYARTYYPASLTVKAGQRIELLAGAEAVGIDIHLVRTPVVSLSGRVFDAPTGGKTVVRLVASAATGGGTQMAPSVKQDGSFQFWQLDPGKYTLVATSTSQGPGLQHGVQAAPVDVEVSDRDIEHIELPMMQPFDVTIQLGFADPKASEAPTMPARPIPGQPPPAEGAPRQPMPRFVMLRPEGPTFLNSSPSMFRPVDIGPEDSFTLEKLLPMRYRLMPSWGVYVKSVTVGRVETEGEILDLRTGPAGPITLTIGSITAEISGVVSDSSGPVAGVRVVLISSLGRSPLFALSTPDGSYKFAAVPPGKYKLIAGDNDLVTQLQSGKDADEYADIAESIEVYAGDKVTKALKRIVPGGK